VHNNSNPHSFSLSHLGSGPPEGHITDINPHSRTDESITDINPHHRVLRDPYPFHCWRAVEAC